MAADALSQKSQGVLASVAPQEWKMLKIMEQFRLQYSNQAHGVLGSLMATPSDSCHSRVIRNQQNLYPKFLLLP